MFSTLFFIFILVTSIYVFLQHPKFGKAPTGKRLERIQKSPHYKKNKFDNLNFTPQFAEDTSVFSVMMRFIFTKNKNLTPNTPLNFPKTDLKDIDPSENLYVWMGHSSYFLQVEGKKILVDPVFSENASPVTFTTKAFSGTTDYKTEDIPDLDYLIITHDHWDHLDYETVKKLIPKVNLVLTALGTGEHLEFWNYDPKKIIELDWSENFDLGGGFKIHAETARHYSGRSFKRSKALWASFIFETPNRKIYIGGDSGYGDHFEKIGKKFGGFDLAILENGQYNMDWRYIHLMPEEFLTAAKDLKAQTIIPVHNSKFALALHDWKEPLEQISTLNQKENLHLITPKIGEKVNWEVHSKLIDKWWKEIE